MFILTPKQKRFSATKNAMVKLTYCSRQNPSLIQSKRTFKSIWPQEEAIMFSKQTKRKR